MSEEQEATEETTEAEKPAEEEAPAEAPVEESKDEEAEKPAEEKPAEEVSEDAKEEVKALIGIVEKQAKEIAEIKALLKKPVHKSLAEPQVKDVPATQKEMSPLDAIA